MKLLKAIAVLALCSGCVPTYGAISSTPMIVQGVGEVYRYQGRANFAHQFEVADQQMAAHCQRVNGGRAVMVAHQTRNVGFGGIMQGQSNTVMSGTATGGPGLASVTGAAATTGFGTGSVMANQNQEILFRCVR
jgi:hypothetical protein